MNKIPPLIIVAFVFGISSVAPAAEVEDYSSTIKVFQDSPAVVQVGTKGASTGASAGPKTGVQAEIPYFKGMANFVHAQGGLMYELSVGGQKFTFEPL